MANEVINLDTVFSGFNSGTDLQPKNTRTNNQGVKINDIAGFVKIVSAALEPRNLYFNKRRYVFCFKYGFTNSMYSNWINASFYRININLNSRSKE